jgi:dTDP-4-amino-4,6-dideoxygalactose transaminase
MQEQKRIAFIDLAAQQARLKPKIDDAIANVLLEGHYILGPQVKQFESELAAFCGAKRAIGCGNGTDALQLALMALGIGKGDAVFCPSFTFAATAECIPLVGATVVFVDSDAATFNMDVESLERAVSAAKKAGLRATAVIPVDLFGLPADLLAIEPIARAHGLKIICDSAQGFGGTINGQMTGTFGDITTTSFFPAKPLGCYGDGGAVLMGDDDLARLIDSLRVHGRGKDKYDNVRIGINSRLDTIQAAILSAKLSVYADEIKVRNQVAGRYSERLSNFVETPLVPSGFRSVWAQYTIKLRSEAERNAVQAVLKAADIPTMVYYPMPIHAQTAYSHFPTDPAGLKVAENLSKCVLSLPMHPYLGEQEQDRIVDFIAATTTRNRQ